MNRKVKKSVVVSAFLSLLLVFGTFFTLGELNNANVVTSSFSTPVPLETATVEDVLDGARIAPAYSGDVSVRGVFDASHRDVYVYVYVNEDFKAFRNVKLGNQFEVDLKQALEKDDEIRVDIAAYNSNKTFSSPVVTVGLRPDFLPPVEEGMTIGPFELKSKLIAGDQAVRGTFPILHKNAFVYVYVNDKYQGGRQITNGNVFNINLNNPVKDGDEVKMKLYSYRTKAVLQGSIVIGE